MRMGALRKTAFALAGLPYPLIQAWRNARWRPDPAGPVALISFDVDYTHDEKALPEMIDVMGKRGVKASFAIIGAHVARDPEIYKRLIAAGHEIVNHTHNHPDNDELCPHRTWAELSHDEHREEIRQAQDTFERELGLRPTGFRLPHFGNLHVEDAQIFYRLLADEGFRYSSSVLDFRMAGKPWISTGEHGVIEIGIATCPVHPYTAMDSYHIERSRRFVYRMYHKNCDLETSLDRSLALTIKRQLPFNIYLDPLDLKGGVLGRLLDKIAAAGMPCLTYTEYLDQRVDGKRSP